MSTAAGRLLTPLGARLVIRATARRRPRPATSSDGRCRACHDDGANASTAPKAATAAAMMCSRPRWVSSFAPRSGKGIEPQRQTHTTSEEEELEEEEDKLHIEKRRAQASSGTRIEDTVKAAGTDEAGESDEASVTIPSSSGDETTQTSTSVAKTLPGPEEFPAAAAAAAGTQGPGKALQTTTAAPRTESSSQPSTSRSASTSGETKAEAGEKSGQGEKAQDTATQAKHSGPLKAVLDMSGPDDAPSSHHQPTMSPPPYVHNFDSYSLVKQLQEGGYTQEQAITAMKGIRALLSQNLDVAQKGLVSKSDVENETYLFRAACSELHQEIKNNRRLQDEQTRQQRTHLQHEVDILAQSLSQEAAALNDQVRGMFNDRRMAVREEQKNQDSAVQQINYKMSTILVSDSRSAIEGVRWILIRRAVLGILFMLTLTVATFRYASYQREERRQAEERKKADAEQAKRDGGKADHSSAADAAVILTAS